MKDSLFFTNDRLSEIYSNATTVIGRLSKVAQLLSLIAVNSGDDIDAEEAETIKSFLDGADYKWVILFNEATLQPLYLYLQKSNANENYTAIRLRNRQGDSVPITDIRSDYYRIHPLDGIVTIGSQEVDFSSLLDSYLSKLTFYESVLQFCEVLYKGELNASVIYSLFSANTNSGGSYALLSNEIVRAYNLSGPQGVLYILTDLLQGFSSSTVDTTTEVITPPNNDYRVIAVAPFALFTQALPEAVSIIANVATWCISPVLGMVASLTTGLISKFKDAVNNATTSSVLNENSIDCTYAPFIRFENVDVSSVYSQFSNIIDQTGVVEAICPQYAIRIYKTNSVAFSLGNSNYTVDVAVRMQYPWMRDLSMTKLNSDSTDKWSREITFANDISTDSTGPVDDPAFFASDENRRSCLVRSLMFLLLVIITGGTMKKGTYYIKGDQYTGEDLDTGFTKFQDLVDWLYHVYMGDTGNIVKWPFIVNSMMTNGDGNWSIPGTFNANGGFYPVYTYVQGANTYILQPSAVQSLVSYALANGTGHFNSVGGVPAPLVIPPEYDKTSLMIAAAASVISVAVLTGVAFKASRGIKNLAVKWHAKKYADVARTRDQLLANPTLSNAAAYNKAVKKYNLTGKLGGWPAYAANSNDILSGSSSNVISTGIKDSTMIAGIQQSTTDQHDLLRSVDTELAEQRVLINDISQLIK